MRNLKFLGVSFLLAMTAATSGVAQNPISRQNIPLIRLRGI